MELVFTKQVRPCVRCQSGFKPDYPAAQMCQPCRKKHGPVENDTEEEVEVQQIEDNGSIGYQ